MESSYCTVVSRFHLPMTQPMTYTCSTASIVKGLRSKARAMPRQDSSSASPQAVRGLGNFKDLRMGQSHAKRQTLDESWGSSQRPDFARPLNTPAFTLRKAEQGKVLASKASTCQDRFARWFSERLPGKCTTPPSQMHLCHTVQPCPWNSCDDD